MNVQVKKMASKTQHGICMLTKDICKELKISEGRSYKLNLGQRAADCLIRSEGSQQGCAWLSEALYDELLFFGSTSLNIWKKGANIYFGPVVGMVVPNGDLKQIRNGKIPEGVTEHVQLAGPCEKCLSYCFCADNVDWENKRIKGFAFSKRLNRWRELWVPMPDVAYDRTLFFNKNEKNLAYEMWKLRMKNYGVEFINRHTNIGRWPAYEHLSKYGEVSSYLPETVCYNNFQDVLDMLEKHGFICFKPSTVSQDKESIVIEKDEERYAINLDKGNFKLGFSYNRENFRMLVERFVEEKKKKGRKNFIIQQGIKPMEHNDLKLMLSMLMEKNEQGTWQVARCHMTCDGEGPMEKRRMDSYERICFQLACSSGNAAIPAQDDLMMISKQIATCMEKGFGHIGEMEMKMVIDENGKAWFIEDNLKPEKYRIPGIDGMEGPLPEALAIFKYATYLAMNR